MANQRNPWLRQSGEQVKPLSTDVGQRAYAIGVDGDALEPAIGPGQFAVFDPDAGLARKGEIVCLWLHDEEEPIVVRLLLAVPPSDIACAELAPALFIETCKGQGRPLSMSRVRGVHRMVGLAEPMEATDD